MSDQPVPSRDEVWWCERIWYWPYYGFCPSEKAWYAEMKKTQKWAESDGQTAIPPWPDPKEAMVSRLVVTERDEDNGFVNKLVQIVTINDRFDNRPIDSIVGVIVHEAVHIFRALCKEIGERKPSSEFSAYTLQTITQKLLEGYLLTRRPGEFVTLGSKEAEEESSREPPIAGDRSDAGSERKAPPDQIPPSLPPAAAPKVSHPRRRKAARPPPHAR